MSKNLKKVLVLVAVVLLFGVWFLMRNNDKEITKILRSGIELSFKTQEVFMNDLENSIEDDATNSIRNIIILACYESNCSSVNYIDGTSGELTINGDVATYIENGIVITVSGIKTEGQRFVTAYDQESGVTMTGSFEVIFDHDAEDAANDGRKSNYHISAGHAAEDRDVDGVIDGTVDGEFMDNISGTVAGNNKIENDASLNYDSAGNLMKDSELPKQEVVVVYPSQNEQKPSTPQAKETAVSEVSDQVNEEVKSEQTLSQSVGSVCVISSPDSDECEFTVFGNGTKTVVGTREELELQSIGDGLFNSKFGLLQN